MITTITRFLEVLERKIGNTEHLIELAEENKQFKEADKLYTKLSVYQEILTMIENE